jgi:hypothetical protein
VATFELVVVAKLPAEFGQRGELLRASQLKLAHPWCLERKQELSEPNSTAALFLLRILKRGDTDAGHPLSATYVASVVAFLFPLTE